jgi:hypothetical protein
MQPGHLAISAYRRHLQRISLWVTVGLYTAALPYVVLVFQAIDLHFSPQIAGKVPLAIIILFAAIYAAICVKQKTAARGAVILAAGAVIVLLILYFETNANKYIHIPEYILMTWILYQALAFDYRGRGILPLILACAAMLGIVDELLQGIHPQRTYGGRDMMINTSSSFIGILMLMGVKDPIPGNWRWLECLKHFKSLLAAILFGVLMTVPMCLYLFEVQAQQRFQNEYPRWLLTGNGLFLATAVAAITFYWCNRKRSGRFRADSAFDAPDSHTTALLWMMCPLAILISMHSLVVWVAAAGIEFR